MIPLLQLKQYYDHNETNKTTTYHRCRVAQEAGHADNIIPYVHATILERLVRCAPLALDF